MLYQCLYYMLVETGKLTNIIEMLCLNLLMITYVVNIVPLTKI